MPDGIPRIEGTVELAGLANLGQPGASPPAPRLPQISFSLTAHQPTLKLLERLGKVKHLGARQRLYKVSSKKEVVSLSMLRSCSPQ